MKKFAQIICFSAIYNQLQNDNASCLQRTTVMGALEARRHSHNRSMSCGTLRSAL